MMRALLLGLLLSLLALGAQAQDVGIRSGEHPDFTRLVLTIPAGTDWQLERVGTRYALGLPAGLTMRPDGVFERIPRSRIATLTADGPDLLIDLACDCHATAFLWRADRLVIDINDGPPPADSPFEQAVAPAAPAPAIVLPIIAPALAAQVPGYLPDPFVTEVEDRARLQELGTALREGVARAATAGLLQTQVAPQADPGQVVPPPDDHAAMAHEPAHPAPMAAARDTATIAPPGHAAAAPVAASAPLQDHDASPAHTGMTTGATPGLELSNAIERASDLPELAVIDGRCLPDSVFDLPNWATGSDFASQIGWARAALGTSDSPAPDAVEQMARTYLYFGFGQEAVVTLALDGRRSTEREILLAMARVIDATPDDGNAADAFAGQANCPGPGALWAALARRSLDGSDETGRIAIETAYRALPSPLRSHLAPRLAQLFLDAGDPATAEALLAPMAATGQSASLEAELTLAEISLTTEGPASAIAALAALAQTDDRMTPAALLRLMQLAHAAGRPLDPDVTDLAAAMQYEVRGTAEAAALQMARARAALDVQSYAGALDLIDAVADPAEARTLRGEAALALAQHASDAAFAELAFARLDQDLPAVAANAVAARLQALGFAERALALLTPPAFGADMAERRYLRADAATALGRWIAADAALAGLSGPRADALRSRLLTAQGEFGAAAAEPGVVPNAALAWRAGAWDALVGGDDPLLTAASAARLSDPAAIADPAAPPLAASAALLIRAEATRALAADLLARFADSGSAAAAPGG